MRLKAGIFVAALTRRIFAEGGMAAVERHGADDAGAIFIRIRHRDGSGSLAAPAPQTAFDDAQPGTRLFELRKSRVPEAEITEALAREARFDSDIWVVEIETDSPETYLDFVEG
ncbi:MAG: DUF1491 family protein [Hoeflea sp.]|uniref:DUF1491 family protein n=1 Tax=Hoeflea sp. TaxID=1940281 RepID=UPI001D8F6F51|nr:DUF1491 family protein [Hoeflea sp.]MBU4530184.1 DUF1491 family protein [Alphaproteobacteria bacterium]MBU4542531.1 DUF1491 family protein [Alphaproteobacteria bacterium]MBU4551212.1 DUF1491 family protein [Alphaproteobacteria bacterium]MBV1723035.1 DUF1491 family protein [Hoeflea sp.]MBV1760046.1 DUF1491 family protein [Hoeflea sp.]